MTTYESLLERLTEKKARMDKFRPLSKEQVKELERNTRIEHVWSSNAIEGNHLDKYETASILNTGMTIHGASIKDILETLDLNDAYEYMQDLATQKQPLNQTVIRDLNRLATLQTAEKKSDAGVYRAIDVWPNGFEQHPYTPPFEIRPEMDQLVSWAEKAQKELHPVQYATDLHQRFVSIHPFIDGNGRTARLLMNMSLTEAGYPVINVQPDKASRGKYMEALESARNGEPNEFRQLIAGYVDQELDRRLDVLQLNEENHKEADRDQSLIARKMRASQQMNDLER